MPRRGRSHRRHRTTDLVLLGAVAILVIVLGTLSSRGRPWGDPSRAETVTIDASTVGARQLPPGFLGLSLEYSAVPQYAGGDPAALDPVFTQLVRDLTPGSTPVLRIGGDSADWSWWPQPGVRRPAGATFTLDSNWISVTHALATALRARLILGINLEARDPAVAAAQATALVDGLGRSSIAALELGNEPELYGRFAWYRTPSGRGVTGRPASYSFADYSSDFASVAASLPSLPLAGPTFGDFAWTPHVGEFVALAPRLGEVTLHRYPLQNCFIPPGSPRFPSIAHLLAPAASTGLADKFAPFATLAHAHGLPLRFDELNTVSCGAAPRVSITFAAALWVVDALFELARVGVDGVNVHTFPGAGYELFRISHGGGAWRASVSPEFYGLLMFARATPPGSELLDLAHSPSAAVKVWATRTPDGTLRVVAINKDPHRGHAVALRVAGRHGAATVQWLRAPGPAASTGVSLAGQSFGATTSTGVPAGRFTTTRMAPSAHGYRLDLPAASAALATFGPA